MLLNQDIKIQLKYKIINSKTKIFPVIYWKTFSIYSFFYKKLENVTYRQTTKIYEMKIHIF